MPQKHQTPARDPNEVLFSALVDAAHPSLPDGIQDLKDIYRRLGIAAGQNLSRDRVTKHLSAQIAAAFRSAGVPQTDGTDLQSLKHQLLLRYFADGLPLHPYYTFLDRIMAATREDGWKAPSLSHRAPWAAALIHAADCDLLHNGSFRHSDAMIRTLHPRQQAVAESATFLRRAGYKLRILGGRIDLDSDVEQQIARRIDDKVRSAGGAQFATHLFSALAPTYDPPIERYHTTRHALTVGQKANPSAPWAYLLNLCVKHIGSATTNEPHFQASANEAINLATAFSAVSVRPATTYLSKRPPAKLAG